MLTALIALGCGEGLPPPYLVDNLRILGVRAEPPEGLAGTRVELTTLTQAPDGAGEIEMAWAACVGAAGNDTAALPCATFTPIAFGDEASYLLPEAALAGRPADENGQVVVTLAAALVADGGLGGCMAAFAETGIAPEYCRVAVKRVNVLRGGTPNANPIAEALALAGEQLVVTLAPDAVEETPEGPELLVLSWYVTAGELERYRTNADDDGRENRWTPAGQVGRVAVVVRDGRGGESWVLRERMP